MSYFRELVEGVAQEALDCGMRPYHISQIFQYVGTELESKRLARKPLSSYLPPSTPQPQDANRPPTDLVSLPSPQAKKPDASDIAAFPDASAVILLPLAASK